MSIPHLAIQSIHGIFTVKVGGILIRELRHDDLEIVGRIPTHMVVPGIRFVLEHHVSVSRRDTSVMMGPGYLAAFYNRAAAATACNVIAAAMAMGANEDFAVCDIRQWETHGREAYENSYEENRRIYEQQQRLRRGPNQRAIDLGDAPEAAANHQDDLNAIMRTPGPLEARRARYEDIFGVEPGSVQPQQINQPRATTALSALGITPERFAEEQRAMAEEARFQAEQQEMVQAAQQEPIGIADRGVGQAPGVQGPPGEAEEASGYSRIYPAGGGMLLMDPNGDIAEVVGAALGRFQVGGRLPPGTLFTTIDGQQREHTAPPEPTMDTSGDADPAVSQSRPTAETIAAVPGPPANPFMLDPRVGNLIELMLDAIHPYTSPQQQRAIRDQLAMFADHAANNSLQESLSALAQFATQRWQYLLVEGTTRPSDAMIALLGTNMQSLINGVAAVTYDIVPVLARENMLDALTEYEDHTVRAFASSLRAAWAEVQRTRPRLAGNEGEVGNPLPVYVGANHRELEELAAAMATNVSPTGRRMLLGTWRAMGTIRGAVLDIFRDVWARADQLQQPPRPVPYRGPTAAAPASPAGVIGATGPVGHAGDGRVAVRDPDELDRAIDTDRPVRDVNRAEANSRRIFGPPDVTRPA